MVDWSWDCSGHHSDWEEEKDRHVKVQVSLKRNSVKAVRASWKFLVIWEECLESYSVLWSNMAGAGKLKTGAGKDRGVLSPLVPLQFSAYLNYLCLKVSWSGFG